MNDDDPALQAISAVTLFTTDMARAVAFYRALGFVPAHGGPDAAFTSFHVGPGFLNLALGHPPSAPWGRTIIHVSDVDAMYRRVRDAGFAVETEPADAPWGERFFHVRDPDGHELSFARPL